MVMDRNMTWGGEHPVQCTDDVLYNCAPEACIIFLTNAIIINPIKREKITELENRKQIECNRF